MAGNLTAMIAAIFSGSAVSTDPYFNYTTLLLSTTATNGQQNNTFQDSSTNNFTITRNPATGPNAPTQGTFSPFSQTGWGNFATATSASVGFSCTTASLVGQTVSTFTAECWIYMTEAPVSGDGIPALIGMDATYNSSIYLGFGPNASRVLVLRWFDGASKTVTGSTTLALNTWYHVAVVANSNALAMYVNGNLETLSGTTTLTNRNGTTTDFSLLLNSSSSNYQFRGYVSNIRVCTSAVYTTSFTPSTLPLTTTSQGATNCQLLTAQDNRFIDKSSNGYLLVAQGSPSVVPFSPFNPTSAWSASTVGGSGYFDGTSDYLTVNDNAALELGSSNFCLEFMYYPTSSANTDFVTKRVNAASYGVIIVQTGLALNFWLSSSGSSWDLFSNAALGSVTLNAWNHLAIYRIGNAWYSSLNGTITTLSASLSGSVVNNAANWNIGGNNYASGSVIGYLSNFRLVIGSSVYTSTSAPIPTAPLTAVTNTQLLLNFTNSGIYDATAKNVLETVGDAQASTTITKWSPTSMKFDGTGDYAVTPASPLNAFLTGDFTCEFWVYFNALATNQTVMGTASGFQTGGYQWIQLASNTLTFRMEITSGAINVATGALSTGQWYHIAAARSGTTVRVFVNGVLANSTTTGGSISDSTGNKVIVGNTVELQATRFFNGYLQDVRVTRGIARYTANFTPPTAAFPVQ